MTEGAPTTSAAVSRDVVDDDDNVDWRRLLQRTAIAAAVLAFCLSIVVARAFGRAAPTHQTAQHLADAVMGHVSGPVVVDTEALGGLARFDVEVLRARAGVDRASARLDVHDHGFSLPALVLAGISAGGSQEIAAFADEVARFLGAARTGGGATCCGAFKPAHCEIRATTERPVMRLDTELFVDCRDQSDNLLTFLVVDGAVVQVAPSTVGRTALTLRAAHR